MAVEDRTVLVELRPRHETGPVNPEVVKGIASWSINGSEMLELYNASKELVATFRDWSFVKFLEPKNGS